MKRGVFDVLRRALDNTLANWQLILLRLGETLLVGILTVVAIFAIVLPILVSAGIRLANVGSPEELAATMLAFLQQWVLLLWIVFAFSVLMLVWLAIHSFVTAGCARVYIDGERIAGPQAEGVRTRYRVFSMQRWFAGGADGWATLFWIYNIAWGAAGLIMLIPLLPTLILMLLLREQEAAAIGIGCLGLIVTLMLMLVVGVVTAMWTTRAIAGWGVRRAGARDALAAGWAAMRADFGRHLLIALAVLVVGLAGSAFFSSFSLFAAFGEILGSGTERSAMLPLFFLPLRFAASFLGSIFSSIVGSWYLASYSSLAVEGRS